MTKKQQTIDTYNTSAKSFAEKFNGQGIRTSDIEETFASINKINPAVLEIGCGNGRDAEKILTHTNNYLGLDVSEKLLELAREKVPGARFQCTDIETYEFPHNLDVIFAFASLIHVPKDSFKQILERSYLALNTKGIFRISLKYNSKYFEVTKTDEFGTRTYFHYSPNDIEEIKGQYAIKKCEIEKIRDQEWLEVLLQKI